MRRRWQQRSAVVSRLRHVRSKLIISKAKEPRRLSAHVCESERGGEHVYTCIYVCTYIYTYMCMYMYIYTYIYMCMCVYIYIYEERGRDIWAPMCVTVREGMNMYIRVYMCVHTFKHIYICIYIYKYIYDIYIHIYIYIHMERGCDIWAPMCVRVRKGVNMYIRTYMCVHTFIHIHICICIYIYI